MSDFKMENGSFDIIEDNKQNFKKIFYDKQIVEDKVSALKDLFPEVFDDDENINKIKDLFPEVFGLNNAVYKIKDLFPEVFTEDDKINFNVLKDILDKDYIETNEEFYDFTWWGKSEARKFFNESTNSTLRPIIEDKKIWNETNNLYIEGDNKEVLKILLNSYKNKIKMIYIDPPYNKNKDLIYDDYYGESEEEHLKRTNQMNEEGVKLVANPNTSDRNHSRCN